MQWYLFKKAHLQCSSSTTRGYRSYIGLVEPYVMREFSEQINALQKKELREIAAKIVADGKGILAADESTGKMVTG